MLSLSRFPCSVILLSALCVQDVFAGSQFSQAYEAAQAGDYQHAVKLWVPLAEQGMPSAQYALGWMYESGQGVAQDYQRAAYWYKQAADQGNAAAQYVLATMYNSGLGVALNQQQAVKWFLKAAKQGDASAQYKLATHFQNGWGIKQSSSESVFWFSKAAEQGHLRAQIDLGKIYQAGQGSRQNYHLAIHWYERAAAQDNGLAQFQLARLYEEGLGTAQNYLQAKSLYLKSADNHYAPSAYKIAEFYEQGKAGHSDLKEALQWYKRAANQGDSAAQFKLGAIYQNGTGVAQNIHSAIAWYFSAALQNHAQAYYQLGTIYDGGITDNNGGQIIKANYYKAAEYYQHASQLDYHLADARLAFLYEQGLGVAVDLKRAISLYQHSTQAWAQTRFKALSKMMNCLQTATTKLFSVTIACTNRKVLDRQIKAQNITAITEKSNGSSDAYFTGAIIPGSSELQITYTKEALFARATYTFVGRKQSKLIAYLKTQLNEKYAHPDRRSGDIAQGEVSWQWLLDDGIELTVKRDWPDTTTFVSYAFPEHLALLEEQKSTVPK